MGNLFSALNPLELITAPLEAVASIGSSLINAHSQKETNKANARINQANNQFNHDEAVLNRDFQSKEAFKTRQFNSQEALAADKRARDLTLEMFNKENEYNSPVNQMARLRQAGINPMSYSNIASINTPASATMASSPSASAGSSPSGSAASASSPIAMQPLHYGNPLMDMAQLRLMNAQAKNVDADTNKTKEEAETINQMRQGQVDLLNTQVNLNLENEKLSRAQAQYALAQCRQIDSNINVASMQVRKMQEEINGLIQMGRLTEKQLETYDERFQAELAELFSRTASNYAGVQVSYAQCRDLASQIHLRDLQSGVVKVNLDELYKTSDSRVDVTIASNMRELGKLGIINGTNPHANMFNYIDWFTGTLGNPKISGIVSPLLTIGKFLK